MRAILSRLLRLGSHRKGRFWAGLAALTTVGLLAGWASGRADGRSWVVGIGLVAIAAGLAQAAAANLRRSRQLRRPSPAAMRAGLTMTSEVFTVIGTFLALAALVLPIGPDESDAGTKPPRTTETTDVSGSTEPDEACGEDGGTEAAVSAVVARGPVFSDVTYAVRQLEDGRPGLTIWGRQTGDVPAGRTIFVLAHPQERPTDELGNHGSERYLPALEIRDNEGCWTMPERAIGYPQIWGVTYQYQFHLVDAATARAFRLYKEYFEGHRECISHGYSEQEIHSFGTELIAEIPIPTSGIHHRKVTEALDQVECPRPPGASPS